MARTREPEIEFDPRHRIVGAIVLVTLAVIFFPLILDEHPNHKFAAFDSTASDSSTQPEIVASDTSSKSEKVIIKKITINSASTGSRIERTADKLPAGENKISKAASEAPSKSVHATSTKTVSTTKAAASAKPVEKKTVAIDARKKQEAVVQAGWTVQVGTFSNQTNVRRLKKQLEQKGFSVLFKDIKLKQGSAVRVRVGPYSNRASADKAQDKIRQDIGIKGVVVASP